MKFLSYVCVLSTVATGLGGCQTTAGKHLSAVGERMQSHNSNAGSGTKTDSGKKNSDKEKHASLAEKIGRTTEPGVFISIDDSRYAVAERRYVSLTGQPCVIATVGSYNGTGLAAAEETDMLNSPYFASEERRLSCKRAGVWSLYPYHGRNVTGE